MTACVNKRRALAAALAGVLALGGAALAVTPGVALASGATAQVATDSELTAGTATPKFYRDAQDDGKYDDAVTVLTDKDGGQYIAAARSDDGTYNIPAVVSVSSVTIAGGKKTVNVTSANISDYRVEVYKVLADGTKGARVAGEKLTSAGDYVLVVTALDGDYAGQVFESKFSVEPIQLPAVSAYENGDTTDTTFTYTGSALDVDFVTTSLSTNKALVEGTDYEVSYKIGNQSVDSVKDAGTYTATLTGLGVYAGTTATTTLKVNTFILNNGVNVEIDPFTTDPTHPSRVYWIDSAGHRTDLDPTLVGLTGAVSKPSTRAYTFTLTVDEKTVGSNVQIGTLTTATGYKVDSLVDFYYNGSAMSTSYELVTPEGFAKASVTAKYGSQLVPVTVKVDYKTKAPGVTYGASAEADLAAGVPGVYTVSASVAVAQDTTSGNKSSDGDAYVYAGAIESTVTVYKGSIDADKTVYVYPGTSAVAIDKYAKGYDGSELTSAFFDVRLASDTATSTDLSWKLVQDGKTVKTATEAGEYALEITSQWYKLSGTTTVPVTVSKVDLTKAYVGALVKWNVKSGEEYVPAANKYVNTAAAAIKNLDLEYSPVPYSVPECCSVDVEILDNGVWKPVGKISTAGSYRVTIAVSDDIASNFVLPEGEDSVTLEFTVANAGAFSDVQPSAWYYEFVNKAKALGYMNGYGNSSATFAPEATLTRAQAVQVLYNMSGASGTTWYSKNNETQNGYYTDNGFVTGFADVDGNEKCTWAAEAIAWAKSLGIVSGYGDTGNFGPDDAVTREQFAKMLALYAEKVNAADITSDGAALAKKSDASSVDSWAVDYVAWCCDEGIFSVDQVRPTDTITRAEVAKMVVTYQPQRNGHSGV